MMSVSNTMETEEDLLPCLHIKIYHPQQHCQALYQLLPLGSRCQHSADDPLRLGRDDGACTFAFFDARVSRKQLSLQAYRSRHSVDMLFTIQNLSQRSRLFVNSSELDYLEKMDLPDKALVRFGQYQILIVRESGEAKGSFEVEFEVLTVSPARETGVCAPTGAPVVDSGSWDPKSYLAELGSHGPLETDETLICHS